MNGGVTQASSLQAFFMALMSSHPAGSQLAYLFLLMWPSLEHRKVFQFGGGDMAFGIAAVGLMEDFVSVRAQGV